MIGTAVLLLSLCCSLLLLPLVLMMIMMELWLTVLLMAPLLSAVCEKKGTVESLNLVFRPLAAFGVWLQYMPD